VQEIAPGIHHWTAFHPNIKQDVCSYYVESAGMLVDPMEPPDGLGFFESLDPKPQQIVLTNRHHFRHSDRFREAFGCPVRCIEVGLHEFSDDQQVEGFEFGDELAPGVVAVEIGGICPDDTALHIQHAGGAIAFADGVIRYGGEVGFVPDGFMDDPPRDKQAIKDSCRGLLERDFDHLLFAHGEPLIGGGHAALKEFVNKPVGEEDYGATT
jgi:hypothetical protein